MASALQNRIDNLVDLMESTRHDFSTVRGTGLVSRPLSYFRPAEPLLWNMASQLSDIDPDRAFFYDVRPSDLGEWDECLLVQPHEEDKAEVLFSVQRFRRVPLRLARGASLKSSWVGAMAVGFVERDGRFHSGEYLVNWVNGRWRDLDPTRDVDPEDTQRSCQIALGFAFTRDYEWTVQFERPSGLSLKFVTDPSGARSAFRLRDVPEGRKRRAALRNWITEHWRRRSGDAEAESFVRSHLRGATAFDWQGYRCTIIPSAFDQRRNKSASLKR